jgi:hypothetical protein
VAALLIALIDIPSFSLPDFSGSLGRIANSLEAIADPAEATPPSRSQKKKARITASKSVAHSAGRRTEIEALPNKAQIDQLQSASANGRPRKQGR